MKTPETKRILIVDDDTTTAKSIKMYLDFVELKGQNVETLAVPDYGSALEHINQARSDHLRQFDLIVGDLVTGPPMNLMDFIKVLGSLRIAIPIIATSGWELKIKPDYYVPGGPKIIATYHKSVEDAEKLGTEVSSFLHSLR
ncbi:response regulator [Candidatus Microgenomates bacterium]|nr:response regulator [Candidatus Microgenomates bacterium]